MVRDCASANIVISAAPPVKPHAAEPAPRDATTAHALLLSGLLALFCARVAGQLAVATGHAAWLPPMEAWYSGLLPYRWLLPVQVLVIALFGWAAVQFWTGRGWATRPDRRVGTALLWSGTIYAAAMAVRYAARMTMLPEERWTGGAIPIVFHLVLAGFLLTLAHFHRQAPASSGAGARVAAASNPRALTWVAFPGTMLAAFLVFAFLQDLVGVTAVSAYGAVCFGAAAVTALELLIPYDRRWQPNRRDVASDLLFLTTIQMALPYALRMALPYVVTVAMTVWVAGLFGGAIGPPAWLWPHAWPVAVQVVLMLLVAELFRYWLHVAAHNTKLLWRFHAVHHSPPKLYWLNVGRFHPIEKTLQFLLDTLPFILIGVSQEVVLLYFVFYAINGFFQHSNVDARYGVLNYVVSGAELHRWHHSRVIDESNRNYGNNLIVWDLVFGTWFLPRDRRVGELGLINRNYPQTFGAQMRTPFVPGLDKADVPVPRRRSSETVGRLLLWARMQAVRWSHWRRFMAAARRPRQTQDAWLRRHLARNAATRFGRQHGFAGIRTIEEFAARVPVQSYETLRPYIDEQERTGVPALNAEAPIMYAQTSGTTGAPKLVPFLASTIRSHKRSQALQTYAQYTALPEAYAGKLLPLVSPAVEGYLPTGTPFGSASGHVFKNMPRVTRAKYVLPYEVFEVDDYDLKYLTILRLAIPHADVTFTGAANPSTYVRLLGLLAAHREALLEDIAAGRYRHLGRLRPHVAEAVARRLDAPGPDRLAALADALRPARPTFADIWPDLRLVMTWTGGSCRIALEKLRGAFAEGAIVSELGYIASECRGSIVVDPVRSLAVPAITETFFEFAARQAWDDGDRTTMTVDRLVPGVEYYVIVTTDGGLYRYFMNDLVEVTGRFHDTPTIRFVRKGKGVTSITGEKLYENQAIEAVQTAMRSSGLTTGFFLVLADAAAGCYRVVVELDAARDAEGGLRDVVERVLGRLNLEYRQKRDSGRLGPLEVVPVSPGTADRYKAHCVAAGQREAQFKLLALQYAAECSFDFDACRLPAPAAGGSRTP